MPPENEDTETIPVTPEAPAVASQTEPEYDEDETSIDSEKIADILHFDPFQAAREERDEAQQAEGEGEGGEGAAAVGARAGGDQPTPQTAPTEGAVAGAQPAQLETESAPAPGGAQAPSYPEFQTLKELVLQQNETIRLLREQVQGGRTSTTERSSAGSVQPPSQQAGQSDDVPAHEYDIPDNLLNGLASDDMDVRKRAVQLLVKGTAQNVHRAMREELRQALDRTRSQIASDSNTQSESQAIMRDFYSTFPQLNHEGLRNFVREATQQVSTEQGGFKAWTSEFRDAIGRRAIRNIQSVYQQLVPVAGGAPPPTPAPQSPTVAVARATPSHSGRPPKQIGVNSRPGAAPADDVAVEIAAMMDNFGMS